jgi:uncharacterized protein DUF4157
MHDHDRIETDILRPKAARLEEAELGHSLHAALTGRRDTLTPDGVLGLQRSAGNAGTAALVEEEERSPVHDVIASPGEPLARDVREDMEGRLGHDFGDVRVHTDGAADASARGVNAHAYTVGSHVVFQRSAFDPGSHAGRTTLAHELTHVIQQRNGPVDGTPAAGGISVSDPSDRFEREASATAEQAMSMPALVHRDAVAGDLPEEELLQGLFVQRHEDEERESLQAESKSDQR